MAGKRYKPRDKIVRKMTRDGAAEVNRSTGEEKNVSSRQKDFSVRASRAARAEKSNGAAEVKRRRIKVSNQHTGRYYARGAAEEPKAEPAAGKSRAKRQIQAEAQLRTAQARHYFTGERLAEAKEKLPTRRKFTLEREAETGKSKLRFDKHLVSEKQYMDGSKFKQARRRGLQQGYSSMRSKFSSSIREENTSVVALDKGERLAEKGVYKLYRHIKRTPFRKVRKFEKMTAKASGNLAYRTFIAKNPAMQGKSIVKMFQRARIKRQYIAAARGKKTLQMTLKAAAKAVGAAVKLVAANIVPISMAVGVIIGIVIAFSLISIIGQGILNGILVPAYKSEDNAIRDSDLLWTQLTVDLEEKIKNMKASNWGYDAYEFDLDPIPEHDPFELIAYLSTMYEDFTFNSVEGAIKSLHSSMFVLSTHVKREILFYDQDDNPYYWETLVTVLRVKPFDTVITPILNAHEDGRELYEIYKEMKGGHQQYGNPVGFMWLSSVSSNYGYRENPTGSGRELHRGLDIAVPEDTPLYSAVGGTVTSAVYHSDFGWTVIVKDKDGKEVRYAHCNELLAAEGQVVLRGQKIALSGNTGNSTGPHVHIEISQNGEYQNPLFLLEFSEKTE